jgi:hypothetical protein
MMTLFVGEYHCPSTSWEIPDLKKNRITIAENEKVLHRCSLTAEYIKDKPFRFSSDDTWLQKYGGSIV